jgi:hypothetical protein
MCTVMILAYCKAKFKINPFACAALAAQAFSISSLIQ